MVDVVESLLLFVGLGKERILVRLGGRGLWLSSCSLRACLLSIVLCWIGRLGSRSQKLDFDGLIRQQN
jgi:hypothetical protein